MMRKLIVSNIVSLDGYYEGRGKNVMPLFDYRREAYPEDASFDIYNAERLRAAGTLLLGRLSFEGFKAYWPPVADDSAAPPVLREVSRLIHAIDKIVVSDSLNQRDTAPWNGVRIASRSGLIERVADLKRGTGKDILILGSRALWNELVRAGLVDELHLTIAPVVLGAGTPAFSSEVRPSLRLIDVRTADASGNVLVRYSVAGREGRAGSAEGRDTRIAPGHALPSSQASETGG